MLTLEYQDFNEAFFHLNRLILKKPELIDSVNITMGLINGVHITVKSSQCNKIDLGALGYKYQKWTHLISTYLGSKKIEELKSLGTNIGGLSVGFDFLRKDTHNGACMREIILSREKRGKPWDRVTIVWRTTELQRRWAADLILIHKMLELIPNTNFKSIELYMVSAYQSAMYIIPFVDSVFGMRISELDPNNKYTKVIITREQKYFIPDTSPHSLLASGDRLVTLYKRLKAGYGLPRITANELTLE